MSIRTLSWVVADDMSVTPTAIQRAGVQGDDGATCVEFQVPAALQAGYDLYIELTTAMGEYDKTDALPLVDGKVSFLLPCAWTQDGGKAVLCLVAVEQTANSATPVTVHSEKGRIVFSERHTGFARVQALLQGSIHRLMDVCEKVANRVEEITANVVENVKGSIAERCYRIIEQNTQTAMSFWVGTKEEYEAFKGKKNNVISVVEDDTLFQQLLEKIEAVRVSALQLSGGTLTGSLFTRYGMPVLEAKLIDSVTDFNDLLAPGVYYLNYAFHGNSPNGKDINGILRVEGNYESKYLLQTFYWFGSEIHIDIAPETYVRKIRAKEDGTVLFGKWNQMH